jgi:hypothetical protein
MEMNIGILLNIADVDNLVTAQYAKQTISPQRGVFLADTVCYQKSGHHVQDIYNAISSRETDNNILKYYKSKGWSLAILEQVEWITMGNFLKRQHPIERCKIVQTMHDWQNTGYQKQQFSQNCERQANYNNVDTCFLHSDNLVECPLCCGHIELPFHSMQYNSTLVEEKVIAHYATRPSIPAHRIRVDSIDSETSDP